MSYVRCGLVNSQVRVVRTKSSEGFMSGSREVQAGVIEVVEFKIIWLKVQILPGNGPKPQYRGNLRIEYFGDDDGIQIEVPTKFGVIYLYSNEGENPNGGLQKLTFTRFSKEPWVEPKLVEKGVFSFDYNIVVEIENLIESGFRDYRTFGFTDKIREYLNRNSHLTGYIFGNAFRVV